LKILVLCAFFNLHKDFLFKKRGIDKVTKINTREIVYRSKIVLFNGFG